MDIGEEATELYGSKWLGTPYDIMMALWYLYHFVKPRHRQLSHVVHYYNFEPYDP